MKKAFFVRRDPGNTSAIRSLLLTLVAILLSLAFPAIVIAALHFNPLVAFEDLILGAVGDSYAIANTLIKFAPLLTAGIGVAIAFRAGLWNIGNLGQFLVGGLGAALAAIWIGNLPGGWILALFAGFLTGALWAFLPGLLRAFWSINEVITTLMMNYIGVLLIDYLVTGPLMDKAAGLPQTPRIAEAARLPILGAGGGEIHIGVVVALLVALGFQYILFHTSLGYELRAVGKNPRAAKYGGVDVKLTLLSAMLISGGLSGLAGAGEVLGIHYRLLNGIAGGYEYTPIVVALLGNLSPIGVILPAFVFAGLLVGGQVMQVDIGLSASIVVAIEALIVLFVIGIRYFNTYRIEWREVARVEDRDEMPLPPNPSASIQPDVKSHPRHEKV